MALVPFGGKKKAAPYQDKIAGRMPKQLKSAPPKSPEIGVGDGKIRSVDPGDGLVRGNDMSGKKIA